MEIEKLEKRLGELYDELQEMSNNDNSTSLEEFFRKQEPIRNQIYMIERKMAMIQEPVYEPLDNIGLLMSIEEFKECVEDGGFIDYDGFGVYATRTQQTNITVVPSHVKDGVYRKDFTHVKWYNR